MIGAVIDSVRGLLYWDVIRAIPLSSFGGGGCWMRMSDVGPLAEGRALCVGCRAGASLCSAQMSAAMVHTACSTYRVACLGRLRLCGCRHIVQLSVGIAQLCQHHGTVTDSILG